MLLPLPGAAPVSADFLQLGRSSPAVPTADQLSNVRRWILVPLPLPLRPMMTVM
jgi:hypothetical protein